MSLPEFQRALAEMLMSPAFRTRVADYADGADGALSSFDLSDKELRRLAALARDARLRFDPGSAGASPPSSRAPSQP